MNEPDIQPNAEDRLVASALVAQRPAPAAAFRSELGQTLARRDPGYGHRPPHLWLRVGVLVGVGSALVVLGVLVSTGAI
jgi:hypothetical protein